MQAVVINEHGDTDRMEVHDNWPDPVAGPGSVVVAVKACALNYHDLFTLRGMPGITIPFPLIMGIDIAGEIAEIGPDVDGWQVGDRVLIDPYDTVEHKLVGEMSDGGLADFVVVNARTLMRLPDEVSFADAAALPVAYGTAYRMMVTRGQIKPDEKVLVLGASGGVGTGCVQLARLAGAHVIAAASSESKIEQLIAMGAHEGINYQSDDFMKVVHERHGKPRVSGRGGLDVVVNFTGGDTWGPSLRSLRKGGRLLNCGATAGYSVETDLRYLWTFELDLLGSDGWLRSDLEALVELVRSGQLRPQIDQILPLAQAREAFDLLEQRKVLGKIILEPTPR
ncbi:quinone oxidoreductase family protein [Aeromicrobium sp. P5_D10]